MPFGKQAAICSRHAVLSQTGRSPEVAELSGRFVSRLGTRLSHQEARGAEALAMLMIRARVVYMNAAARNLVGTGRSLRIVNDRFSPTDPAAASALTSALSSVLDQGEAQTLAFSDRDRAGVLATIFPLESEIGGEQTLAAAAAIFIMILP